MPKKRKASEAEAPVGRPPKYTNPDEMQADINKYFEECEEKGKPKTVMGLVLALNMKSRSTLCDYERDGEFADTVKTAKAIVVDEVEQRLLSGGNAGGAIFWLKNNGDYVDKKEIDLDAKVKVKGIQVEFVDPDNDEDEETEEE